MMIHPVFFFTLFITRYGLSILSDWYGQLTSWSIVSSVMIALGYFFVSGLLGYKKHFWLIGTLGLLAAELIISPDIFFVFVATPFHPIMEIAGCRYFYNREALIFAAIAIVLIPLMSFFVGRMIREMVNKKAVKSQKQAFDSLAAPLLEEKEES